MAQSRTEQMSHKMLLSLLKHVVLLLLGTRIQDKGLSWPSAIHRYHKGCFSSETGLYHYQDQDSEMLIVDKTQQIHQMCLCLNINTPRQKYPFCFLQHVFLYLLCVFPGWSWEIQIDFQRDPLDREVTNYTLLFQTTHLKNDLIFLIDQKLPFIVWFSGSFQGVGDSLS